MATPVTLNPKLTQAGLAITPSAQNAGLHVELTHVALGTGRYAPKGDETALKAEVARFPITSGTNPSARTVQVGLTVTDTDPQGRSANGKGIGEVGFYAGNTLWAVWSQDAEPLFYKSQAFDIPLAYVLDVSALPDGAVSVTVDVGKQGLEAMILAHEAKTDPHPQYLTPAEGNAAYAPLSHTTATDPHPQYLTPAEGNAAYAPLSHTTATDPHPQYLTPAEGAAAYAPLAHTSASNPHDQYVLHTEADAAYAPKSHTTDADPHPQYLTPAEGNAAYAPLSHTNAADPHSQYLLKTDAAGGYVKQGGGIGQTSNAVKIGWSAGSKLKATVDTTDLGNIAFEGWVNQLFTNLVGAAPETLNQINELAAAIGNNPNFAVTMANELAGKERKFDAGVRLACASWNAPVGWTTVNDDSTNNRMMRVVNGNAGGAGGAHDPTINNVVPSHTHGFTTGTVSSDHSHGVSDPGHTHGGGNLVGALNQYLSGSSYIEEGRGAPDSPRTWMETAWTGISLGGITSNHTHSGSTDNGSSQTNWTPRYLNITIIQKN